jgi:hypothetical protein
VVEEELGVGRSKITFHSGTSKWENIKEENEELSYLKDVENGYPIEGIKDQAGIIVSNFPNLLKFLLTVSRILKPLYFTSSNSAGRK